MKEHTQGGNMDKSRLLKIIHRKLNLEGDDWLIIEKNLNFKSCFRMLGKMSPILATLFYMDLDLMQQGRILK
jgi:hypothetical protein